MWIRITLKTLNYFKKVSTKLYENIFNTIYIVNISFHKSDLNLEILVNTVNLQVECERFKFFFFLVHRILRKWQMSTKYSRKEND